MCDLRTCMRARARTCVRAFGRAGGRVAHIIGVTGGRFDFLRLFARPRRLGLQRLRCRTRGTRRPRTTSAAGRGQRRGLKGWWPKRHDGDSDLRHKRGRARTQDHRHAQGSGFRVQGSGFRVQGLEFRVQGSGFRV